MNRIKTALSGSVVAIFIGGSTACGGIDPALDEEFATASQDLAAAASQNRKLTRPPPLVREDLSVTSPQDLSALINEGFRFIAQTYTVTHQTVLSGVAVSVTGHTDAQLRVSLRRATDGVPAATTLTQRTLQTNSSGIDEIVRFPNFVLQHPGDEFAIVVDYPSAPPPGPEQFQGYWSGASGSIDGDVYPDGASAASSDGSSWFVTPEDTLHFRTFVLQ